MLLLHCKDNVRLEYIEWLRENFPNMYIQIAHLGVDRRANDLTRILLDKYKADDHIFYDISTVINEKLLDYAMENISSQLLFGSDYPYSPDNNVNSLLNYCKTSNLLCKMNANAELIIELTRK